MKKILCLFSALTLMLISSCTSDDDNSSNTSILPKIVSHSYLYPIQGIPSNNYSSTSVYDGNKILSVKFDNSRSDYTYYRDVIVKLIRYETSSGKDVKFYEEIYSYTNNKLATLSYAQNFSAEYPTGFFRGRSVYTYNSDGTVTTDFYSTSLEGVEAKSSSKISFFANGNLVKEVETDTEPNSNNVRTDVYEYDSKNNPLINILGFNLLINDANLSSLNNITKHTTTAVIDLNTYGPYVSKSDYIYDENGYPTKEVETKSDGQNIETIEYVY